MLLADHQLLFFGDHQSFRWSPFSSASGQCLASLRWWSPAELVGRARHSCLDFKLWSAKPKWHFGTKPFQFRIQASAITAVSYQQQCAWCSSIDPSRIYSVDTVFSKCKTFHRKELWIQLNGRPSPKPTDFWTVCNSEQVCKKIEETSTDRESQFETLKASDWESQIRNLKLRFPKRIFLQVFTEC